MINLSSSYRTKQRELILNCLIANKDRHISAEDIVDHLKKGQTPVGKATVYRYLNILLSQGLIRKYLVGQGAGACFQYIDESSTCQHYHLKCKDCGRLIHLECEFLNQLSSHISSRHNFFVDDSMTVFFGVCSECAADNN